MGWKNVKEHYKISHIVGIYEGHICIGSPYIHDIIRINTDGKIVKEYGDSWAQNEDLLRYMKEMKADQAKLKELIDAPDTFQKSIKVYTYDGAEIIEKECEEVGWPNVTHDGLVMFENTFSTNREQVVKWARRSLESGIEWRENRIAEQEQDLKNSQTELAKDKAELELLNKREK